MAKIIVLRNPYNVKFPNQKDNLLKIMESETEPPKNYLWKTTDGYLYVYNCGIWQYIKDYIKSPKCGCDDPNVEVTQKDLDELKALILEYINNHPGNCEIPEGLEERLLALENRTDNDTIYDDTYIRNLIQQLDEENNNFVTVHEE